MSKKRGKSASGPTGPSKWDTALNTIEFNEDGVWGATVAFILGNHVEDNEFINILCQSVQSGQRKLFTHISKEDLMKNVVEFGNPKAKKGKDVPTNYEICEPCKTYLDAGEDIPLPLLAKLIKFKLLWIKTDDQKRREADKKGSQAVGGKGKGKGDKGGKADRKSAKGKAGGGKKSPEPPNVKEPSKMFKRGEDDPNAEQIDDEPDDGSQKYIIMTGFTHPQLLVYLAEVGVAPDLIIKLQTADYSYFVREKTEEELMKESDEKYKAIEEERKVKEKIEREALLQFWTDFRLIIEGCSQLRNVAVFEYTVDSLIIPDPTAEQEQRVQFGFVMFDCIAELIYRYLDKKRQWKCYLENQNLITVPITSAVKGETTAAEAEVANNETSAHPVLDPVDMRHYNELLDDLPEESISTELVLNCMLDQVDAQSQGIGPPSQQEEQPLQNGLDPKISKMLGSLALKLSLTADEKRIIEQELLPPSAVSSNKDKSPLLVHPQDEISLRTHFLKKNNYFVPRDAEFRMLNNLEPLSHLHPPSIEDNRLCDARLARLQQLIFYCSQGGLSYTDIDHAFRQFVFEYLNITTTDPSGYIVRDGQSDETIIPWDDPYPFFDGLKEIAAKEEEEYASQTMINKSESVMAEVKPSDDEGIADGSAALVEERVPSRSSSPGSILKRKDTDAATPQVLSRQSSVHFTEEAIEKSIKDSPLATPPPSRSNTEVIQDLMEGEKRHLDDRCFAENLDPHVLMQVLRNAIHSLPHMDVYYHMRDNTMFVVLHNPFSKDCLSNHWQWHCAVHSDVGLRDFIEYVSFEVHDWLKEKEAIFLATSLNQELERGQREEDEIKRKAALEEKKNAKKGPKGQARSRSASKSRDSSPEKVPGENDLLIREGSLKAWKLEQERIQREKEEEERRKNEKRTKSGQKRAEKDKADVDKKKGGKGSAKGRKAGKDDNTADAADDSAAVEDSEEEQFVAYDLHDLLGHVSGEITHMFPADGGTIRCERTDVVHGTRTIRTSVFKDDHIFTVHVADPVREITDRFRLESSPGVLPEHLPLTSVSYYGSISAKMSDGLCLALSSYGGEGQPRDTKRPAPQPYNPPAPSRDVSPEAPAATSQRGRKGKSPAPGHEPQAAPTELEPHSDLSEQSLSKTKIDDSPTVDEGFQSMYLSCSDGQLIRIALEPADESGEPRKLVARVQFPTSSNSHGEKHRSRRAQFDEMSRLIRMDGSVMRTMKDGSTQILHPDGAITTGQRPNKTQPVPEDELPKKGESAKKSGKKSKGPNDTDADASQDNEESLSLQWVHTNAQGERMKLALDGTVEENMPPLQSSIATDPSSGEVMYTREDKVAIVHWAEADIVVVEHADGTRITNFSILQPSSSPRSNAETGEDEALVYDLHRFIRIECPGYSSFLLNLSSGELEVTLGGVGGNSVFAASPLGIYHLYHAEGGQISVHEDGTFLYTPRMVQETVFLLGGNAMQPDGVPTYSLRHNADIVCEVVDPEGNVFSVDVSGNSHVMVSATGEEEEEDGVGDASVVSKSKSNVSGLHAPRLFIIRSDGSGTELLRYVDVAEYLNNAERDPTAAVIKQEVQDSPQVVATTVIRPINRTMTDKWTVPYIQDTIVPHGLRPRDLKTFPDAVAVKKRLAASNRSIKWGQLPGEAYNSSTKIGSELPALKNNAVEFRQILQYPPVSEDMRKMLRERLRHFADFTQERLKQDEDLKIQEPRTAEEQESARRLAGLVTKVDIDKPAEAYLLATAPPPTPKPPTPKPKRSAADWERDRRQIEEEKANKEALKLKIVPNYFKSEFSRDFLLSQASDVHDLAKKLHVFPPSEPASRSNSAVKLQDDAIKEVSRLSPELDSGTPGDPQQQRMFTRTNKTKEYNPQIFHADTRHEQYPYYSSKLDAHLLDAEDETKTAFVPLPPYLNSGRPQKQPNLRYAKVEDPVRRKLYTTSVVGGPLIGQLGLRKMRGLNVLPQRLDLGLLREGHTYTAKLHLINTGVESCRWKLAAPPPATGIRLLYETGPIAAGMRREVTVEVYAIAAGVEGASGVGSLSHSLHLLTESDQVSVPVHARIMTAYEYDKHVDLKLSRGVSLVGTRPSSRDGIIRPRRADTGLSLKA